MNRLEVKAAIAEAAAKAKQNRKDYFERKDSNWHYDYRNHKLKVYTRALHIVYAYLRYKPFKSCERYNYKLDVDPLSKYRRVQRYDNQCIAVERAKEFLGFTVEMVIARPPLLHKIVTPNEEFDNWIMGIPRPIVADVIAA